MRIEVINLRFYELFNLANLVETFGIFCNFHKCVTQFVKLE